MASAHTLFPSSSFLFQRNPNLLHSRRPICRRTPSSITASAADLPLNQTKLVTFLGKGGSGKTTSALLAAQYYAKTGLRTCLLIHSQDPTVEHLIGCKIGNSPTLFNDNLSVVRLETTKMLLDPLDRLKKADARLNLTQGVLEGVVGEELGVLPGMDSIFSAIAIEKLVGFHQGIVGERNYPQEKFDVIVYDGISSDETLRTIGAAERARWYLKYLRNMAEKTDLGRLTSPSIIKLADESLRLNSGSQVNGRSSAEIWDDIDKILENITAAYVKPTKFSCYLMMDPGNRATVTSALRFWGCAIQAGVQISGAFGFASQSSIASLDVAKNKISPLPFALMPYIPTRSSVDWDETLKFLGKDAHKLLTASSYTQSSVKFNPAEKSVNLFMPGFDKSEIKLYQYRGGSELLVEAGDQRRVVRLPPNMQGKVVGAKFIERSLVISLRSEIGLSTSCRACCVNVLVQAMTGPTLIRQAGQAGVSLIGSPIVASFCGQVIQLGLIGAWQFNE